MRHQNTAPTWYCVDGEVVTKYKKQCGAVLVRITNSPTPSRYKPIYYDEKRNLVIAIQVNASSQLVFVPASSTITFLIWFTGKGWFSRTFFKGKYMVTIVA